MNIDDFFSNDLIIFCVELRYSVGSADNVPSDIDFRRELWLTRDSVFNDCILKVEDKEIQVSYMISDSYYFLF